MNLKYRYFLYKALFGVIALSALLCLPLAATDEEAEIELTKAKESLSLKKYRDAGDYYLAAKLYADSPEIKKQSLIKAADAYGKADQKYKQFQCLNELIAGFSDQINFEEIIKEEFQLGNDFAQGHRDITLSWMPWIKGKNKAVEIFEAVLEQAPFAKFAPALKLRLGRMYLEADKPQKALNIFRQLMKQHPKSPEDKYARFELANALVQLAIKAGDGDGVYAREADEVLREALKKYPKNPETQWIKQSIEDTDDVRAKRLCGIAEFYVSRKNPEAATRYFHELLARYPDSKYTKTAEANLTKLDTDYTPPPKEKKKAGKNPYPLTALPETPKVILIAPQASGGKWLLPIEDLDLDGKHADAEYHAKLTAEKEAREIARKQRAKRIAAQLAKRKKEEAVRKAKAEAKAKAKAEAEKKAEEETIAAEKVAIEKEKVEKQEKEIIEKAKAEQKEQKEQELKVKAAIGAEKKEKKKKEEKKGNPARKMINKKSDPPADAGISGKSTIKSNSDSSGSSVYIIPVILLILVLLAGIVYYLKKRQTPGAE